MMSFMKIVELTYLYQITCLQTCVVFRKKSKWRKQT